jgi:hypothetical protein
MNDFVNMLNDDQKKALLKALTEDSPTLEQIPENVKKESINHIQSSIRPTANVNDDFTINRQATTNNRRKEQVKGRKNNWVDNGEFRDIETPQFEKTPRRREASKKVDLECHVCGKSFKADPKFVYGEYHRCNRCTGK